MAKKFYPLAHGVPVRFKHNHTVKDVMVSSNRVVAYNKVKLASGAVYPVSHLEVVSR